MKHNYNKKQEVDSSEVMINSKVEILFNGESRTIKIVEPKKADWRKNKMSVHSTLAQMILGHKKGDRVKRVFDTVEINVEIKEVRNK